MGRIRELPLNLFSGANRSERLALQRQPAAVVLCVDKSGWLLREPRTAHNPYVDVHCHSNLTRAVLPYGLTEFDVHDVLNVFQCTGLNADDQYFMKASPARPGDFFEFFAEQDLLCALSTCPAGTSRSRCGGRTPATRSRCAVPWPWRCTARHRN
ncbi:hypothetical protein GCM10027590_11550 [Nocardiopsis nanhaiensis]